MSQSQNITLSNLAVPQFQYLFAHQLTKLTSEDKITPHIHDCYEIYVNVTGNVAFLVNNRLFPVGKGDAIVTRPGDMHICVEQDPHPHERFCFWMNCPEESPLVAFTQRKDFSNLVHFSDDTRRELLRLLFRLKDAEETHREPARTAYVFRLLALFAEGEQQIPEHPALPTAMQQVLDYIHENFPQVHSIEDIAEATHISGSTLNRWFRSYLQLSPHKYVEALKLSYAQRLLLEGKSVTEVCNSSGFSDCSRFIAVFKSKFGETPLQYQKRRQCT